MALTARRSITKTTWIERLIYWRIQWCIWTTIQRSGAPRSATVGRRRRWYCGEIQRAVADSCCSSAHDESIDACLLSLSHLTAIDLVPARDLLCCSEPWRADLATAPNNYDARNLELYANWLRADERFLELVWQCDKADVSVEKCRVVEKRLGKATLHLLVYPGLVENLQIANKVKKIKNGEDCPVLNLLWREKNVVLDH